MPIRAVLFDFGGTLYDYGTLQGGDREALVQLVRAAGVDATPEEIRAAHRDAMRRVFHAYLPRRFYLHRDLFRDAVAAMLAALGAAALDEDLERYRVLQWQLHARDFALRDGVVETLGALRERGLHLGVVSNIDADQLAHMGELAGLAEHFDSILSSEEARSCKPDPEIFAAALRRAGCAAEEALFVGDSIAQDIAGANRVGLRSVLIWSRDDTRPSAGETVADHVIRRIPEILDLVGKD